MTDTGEKPGDPKKIQEVLKNEVRMEYGIKCRILFKSTWTYSWRRYTQAAGRRTVGSTKCNVSKEDFRSIFKIN